jgi:hypothetical protein
VRGGRRDALVLGLFGVELGAAVGEQVVVPVQALVPGAFQVAGGGQHDRTVLQDGAAQQVAVRPGDQRAADPGDAALVLAAVGDRDEDTVGRRVGLRLDDLRGPLPRRAGGVRPVHGGGDEVGAVGGGQPHPLGELQVVADHHGYPADCGVDHGRRSVAGGEDELLLIPQVRLAVDRPGPGLIDQGRAVVQLAVAAPLAEPAHDDQPVFGGQGVPLAQGVAVVRGRGERARLGSCSGGLGPEHITRVAQLGQDDEPGVRGRGLSHRGRGGLAIGVGLADGDGQLSNGDDGVLHVRALRSSGNTTIKAVPVVAYGRREMVCGRKGWQ